MTAVFPQSPMNGERYTVPGGITFQWVSPPGGWVQVGQWQWPPTVTPGAYVEFPPHPQTGTTYTTPSGLVFVYTGEGWRVQGSNIIPSPWFLAGVGEPPNIVGFAGNYYLDLATGNLWGPYNDGMWPYPPAPFIPAQGVAGPVGPQGFPGPEGPQGPIGVEGSAGPIGPQGPVGPTGEDGPQGATGPQGPAGWTTKVFGSFTNNDPSLLPTNGFFPANWDSSGNPPIDTVIPINGSLVYTVTNNLWMYAGTDFTPSGWVNVGSVQGPVGPQGIQGVQGNPGIAGPQGPGGIQGPAGPQGGQGPLGPIGPTGPGGVQGSPGVMGAKGSQGLAGPTGPQGPLGPVGPSGPSVEIIGEFTNKAPSTLPSNGHIPANWDSAGQPPADLYVLDGQGLIYTVTGHVWLYVTADFTPAGWIDIGAMQGPQGVQGVQGIVGPAGAAGAQGIQGPPGVQGPQGPGGGQGIEGPAGATGPAGAQGPAGPQGPQGDQGIPGPPGGLGEAPNDGQFYGRQNLAWAAFPIQDAPSDSNSYVRNNAGWIKDPIQSDAPNDGKMYGRSSSLWGRAVAVAGDTMLGNLSMSNHGITNVSDPVNPQDGATKNYVDVRGGSVTISDTPPVTTVPGNLWWDSVGGNMYVWYNDGTSSQWVVSVNIAGAYVPVGGGTMTGPLTINESGATLPAPTSGTLIQLGSVGASYIQSATFGDTALWGRRAGGTPSSPAATPASSTIINLVAGGYANGAWTTGAAADININSYNAWTATDNSTFINFATTPIGSVVSAEVMRIQPSGGVSIGSGSFDNTDPGQGVLAVQNQVQVNPAGITFPTPLTNTNNILEAAVPTTFQTTIDLTSSVASSNIVLRRTDGPWTAPASIFGGNTLGNILAAGYANGAWTQPKAAINFTSANNWSASDNSTHVCIYTTPIASTTLTEAVRVQPSGGLSVGNSTFNATDPGQGVIAPQNGVQLPSNAPVQDNRVINSGFDVWQLGTNFSITGIALNVYTADQWQVGNQLGSGVVATVNRNPASPPNPTSANMLTWGANGIPANGFFDVIQRFEAAQIADIDSQPATFSFDLWATDSAGAISGLVYFYANTGVDNGTWSNLIWNTSFSITLNTWQRIKLTFTAAQTVGFKNGGYVGIRFTQTGASGNITADIGAVQLTKGPLAQPWVPKGIAREIADCQRFFEKSYDLATVPGSIAQAGNSSFYLFGMPSAGYQAGNYATYKNNKRAIPTVTFYSPNTGASGKVRDYTNNADVGANINASGQTGFSWFAAPSANTNAINLQCHWIADARL